MSTLLSSDIIIFMRRKLLFLLAVILICAGLFLFVKIIDSFKTPGKGALQIKTNIAGTVFLNGTEIGTAPLCKCNESDTIPAGIYDLRIEPEDKTLSAFSTKISINGGVLTAVERTFLPGAFASASILTLEKINSENPELVITSLPDNAIITIDSVSRGATPYKATDLSESEHELKINKEGFQEKTIQIKMIKNHRLIIEAYLGTQGANEKLEQISNQEATSSARLNEEKDDEEEPTEDEAAKIQITTILTTPNGFLRVRSGPGTSFSEVTRVDTGDEFEFISERNAWYQIRIDENTTGWISSQFAEIN